jgi:hypothetical protein
MKTKIINLSLSVLVLAFGATMARAQVITTIAVSDYSFETPAEPDGGGQTLGTNPSYNATGVPYTVSTINGSAGIRNPSVSEFPAAPGSANPNGDNPLTGTSNGHQALYIVADGGPLAPTTATYNASLGSFVAGDTYTLTVAIGNGEGDPSGGTYSLNFLENGIDVGPTASSLAPSGTFSDLTLTYTPTVSGSISFSLGLTGSVAGTATEGFFDNVRLTQATPAPEPSSVALMFAGGVMVMAVSTWRRRSQA